MASIRIKVQGDQAAVYHCMSRIVGKEHLLGAREREVFRRMIRKIADFCGVGVLTYAVMSNHFHVLVGVPGKVEIDDAELVRRVGGLYGEEVARAVEGGLRGEDAESIRREYLQRMGDLSVFIKLLKQRFSIWYNRNNGRVGTLWSERFKSVLVEGSGRALRTVAAYIDLNAVRAGYCSDPKDYRFCGYGEACGGGIEAREGLRLIMERSKQAGWRGAGREYRMILFGKGYYTQLEKEGGIGYEQFKQVRQRKGRLPLADALRCRVKYFSEGTILGSREFVEKRFLEHRERFGPNRVSGARAMRGVEWDGLCTARDLRKDVFG